RAGRVSVRDVHRPGAVHARGSGPALDDAREYAARAAARAQSAAAARSGGRHPQTPRQGPGGALPELPRARARALRHPRQVRRMIAVLLALSLSSPDKLDVRPEADFTILGIGLAGFVVPELLKGQLAPAH